MTRLLTALPLAACLALAYAAPGLAEDPADKCRSEAIEDEVSQEDMEDYIAECLAIVQSGGAEEEAIEEGAAEAAPVSTPAPAATKPQSK